MHSVLKRNTFDVSSLDEEVSWGCSPDQYCPFLGSYAAPCSWGASQAHGVMDSTGLRSQEVYLTNYCGFPPAVTSSYLRTQSPSFLKHSETPSSPAGPWAPAWVSALLLCPPDMPVAATSYRLPPPLSEPVRLLVKSFLENSKSEITVNDGCLSNEIQPSSQTHMFPRTKGQMFQSSLQFHTLGKDFTFESSQLHYRKQSLIIE